MGTGVSAITSLTSVRQRSSRLFCRFIDHIVGIGLAVVENHTVARDVILLAAPGIGGRIAQLSKATQPVAGSYTPRRTAAEMLARVARFFPVVGKQIAQ